MSISLDRIKPATATRLDKLSFEQLLDFAFDRSLADEFWYHEEENEFSFGETSVTTRHLIKLFRQPEILLERYSAEQVEQGFWFVTYLLCFIKFDGLFWDKRLPFSLREDLIFSAFDLFSRFFAHHPSESICFMWWDSLAYGYYMENGQPEDEDGAQVQQAMFETLKKILTIDSEECQKSALHGLGHLKHPATEKTIQDFLRKNRVGKELEEFAHKCIEGTMG